MEEIDGQLGSSACIRSKESLKIPGVTGGTDSFSPLSSDGSSDESMFLALEKPRVRYDVEVVTKLVVYAGKYIERLLEDVTTNDMQVSPGSPAKATPSCLKLQDWV